MNVKQLGSETSIARIFVVDDHPMMIEGLTAQIMNEGDMEMSGESDDVEDALKKIVHLQPDLVVVDISLKTGHGLDLVKRLRKKLPKIKVLVNSMYDEAVYAERSLQAGAHGYVNKRTARTALISAIRTVLAGKIYLSPEMTERVIRGRLGAKLESGESPVESLSNRELEVLTLIGEGKTTGAIANQLFLSVHTIDTYREKLKTKLHLANGAELNRYATQWVLENG